MPATVVVGAQFGDEGKGKIVDYLADRADVVVRFQGGANAGHTVQVGDQLYAFHLLPSGVLRKRTMNVIGNGVVVDPTQLLKEIEETRAHGHSVENLRISDRAHVVMPYHKIIDGLEEKLKGNLRSGVGNGSCLRAHKARTSASTMGSIRMVLRATASPGRPPSVPGWDRNS